jgi:hypothetical protein
MQDPCQEQQPDKNYSTTYATYKAASGYKTCRDELARSCPNLLMAILSSQSGRGRNHKQNEEREMRKTEEFLQQEGRGRHGVVGHGQGAAMEAAIAKNMMMVRRGRMP